VYLFSMPEAFTNCKYGNRTFGGRFALTIVEEAGQRA
jgi:hypothetical protein